MDLNGFNSYEYTVDKKCEGTLKTKRIILISAYLVFFGILCAIVFGIPLLPLGALIPVFMWILVFFTWRYVKISYSYSIESGSLKLVRIYGGRTKRQAAQIRLRDCALIAPLDANLDNLRAFAPQSVFDALPSKNSRDPYLLLATDKNGKKIAVKLQVTQEALKTFKYYNQNTVMSKTQL